MTTIVVRAVQNYVLTIEQGFTYVLACVGNGDGVQGHHSSQRQGE